MKTLVLARNVPCNIKFYKSNVNIVCGCYANGRPALVIVEARGLREQVAVATVNLPDQNCPDGEVFIKDYSENEGMVEWLIQQHIIEPEPNGAVNSGFVRIRRYRLDPRVVVKVDKFLGRLDA